jgi:hypothetical protein
MVETLVILRAPRQRNKNLAPANVLNKSRTPLRRQYGDCLGRGAPPQFVISRMPSPDYVVLSV